MEESIQKLHEILKESDNIVFFGGAGVSTESGIPDFRSVDGLYHMKYDYPPETILSHTFFMNQPGEFYRFYKDKMLCLDKKPNAAHLALAKLETMKCGAFYDAQYIKDSKGVPKCCAKVNGKECGGMVKPDVVLYEEGLDQNTISQSVQAISRADTLIIGGTSLAVYPAAGLIDYFRGNHLVVINKSPTPRDRYADLLIQDSIGKALGEAVEGL